MVHKILFNHKEKLLLHNNELVESLENYAHLKKPIPKGYIICNSIYMTFFKKRWKKGRRKVGGYKRATWEIPCDKDNVLNFYYLSVHIQFVTLYHAFVRGYQWEKLSEGYMTSPYNGFQLHVNL